MSKLKSLLYTYIGLITLLVVLLVWQLLSSSGAFNRVLLPPPTKVFAVLWDILASGSFLKPLGETLRLLALGYFIGSGAGILVGLGMGWNQKIYLLLEPLVELIRPLPKPALIPPLFLFLGIGMTTKITVVALAAFFPVLINTLQGVRGVDPVIVATGRTFGCSRLKALFVIVLPAAMPMILAGMRVSLGLALVLVVLAEMLVDARGIGYLIVDMQRSFKITEMYAWIIILGAIGVLLNAAFEYAERRLVPWHGK